MRLSFSFIGLVTIIFIILRIVHVIDWMWIWVLAPLWISLIIGILIVLLFFWFADKETKRYWEHIDAMHDF